MIAGPTAAELRVALADQLARWAARLAAGRGWAGGRLDLRSHPYQRRITQAATVGPLWDALEAAYTEWHELGRPERDRFGVTAGKRQSVWLDEPDHVITELRAPS